MTTNTFRMVPNPEDKMTPGDLVPKDAFTTDNHSERDAPFFNMPDGSVLTGVWECAPSRMDIDAYPVHEMMTIISGSVTLTHSDGATETFRPGDVFFVPKGTACIWENTETVRKFYMIVA